MKKDAQYSAGNSYQNGESLRRANGFLGCEEKPVGRLYKFHENEPSGYFSQSEVEHHYKTGLDWIFQFFHAGCIEGDISHADAQDDYEEDYGEVEVFIRVGQILGKGEGQQGGDNKRNNNAEFSAAVFDKCKSLDKGSGDKFEAERQVHHAEIAEDYERGINWVEEGYCAT